MLLSNIFYKFFNPERNNYKIVKYSKYEEFELHDEISFQIIEIDKQISENSKALVEAQIVKLRSTFSKSNNFIEKLGYNIYKTKIDESINWHQKQLKELYFRRKQLQVKLEKLKGIFWLNRIKRFVIILFMVFLILLGIFIFLSGFMIVIYLLPFIIIVLLINLIINKNY